MWTVMWLNEEYGRIDYMTGFKTKQDADKYIERCDFLPEEYVTVAETE